MGSRVIATLVLVCSLAPGTFASQQQSAAWPPPGVLAPQDVDTPPKATNRVGPEYTSEAMRAGIAGSVQLQCVVQADGSVGDVRVVRSLDAIHGLDQAAIAALKQWRFQPALKDGKPVATTARVELSFTLGNDLSSPLLSWPKAFEDAAAAGAWKTDEFVEGDLLFHIESPEDWSERHDQSPGFLVEITNSVLAARLAIRTPAPTSTTFERPFDQKQLKALEDRMRQLAATNPSITPESRGFGQMSAGGRVWVWSEWYVQGTTVWTFQTAAEGQAIIAVCTVMLPATATDDERLQRRNQAAAPLGAMLRRMTIKPKQP